MTYEDIMDDAYGLSLKTQPQDVATEHPELTGVIYRSLQALYSIAASVNPTFFGVEAALSAPGANSGWDKPADMESGFYLEDANGDETVVVRIGEWDVEPEKPKVYSLGGKLWTVGNAEDPDPSSDALTLYYASTPGSSPAGKTDSLPTLWPEAHNTLLVYQVGLYIAAKDMGSQSDEFPVFQRERDAALSRFIRRLELDLANVRTQFSSARYAESQSIVSHREMLTGALGAQGGG